MAMLDIGALLNQQLRDNSLESRREGNIVTAMLANQVNQVAEAAIDKYEASAQSTEKAVAAKLMTPEQQLEVLNARKMLRDAQVNFAARYYAG